MIAAAAAGADLPLSFEDPREGVLLARYREAASIALLHVYPWEFEPDESEEDQLARWPFEHDIDVYSVAPDGSLAFSSGGGSDWQLALGRLAAGAPIWLSGFSSGSYVSGAVSDLAQLEMLPAIGAEAGVPTSDAPTGAFIAKLRDDVAAREQWESHLMTFPREYYPSDPRITDT